MVVKKYFIVTPLKDQQKIVKTILGYWDSSSGIAYNKSRADAVSHVKLVESLDAVKAAIKAQEGVEPLGYCNLGPIGRGSSFYFVLRSAKKSGAHKEAGAL